MSTFTRQHFTMIADTLNFRAQTNVEQATIYLDWLQANNINDVESGLYEFNRDFALLFAAAIHEDCRCMESFAREFSEEWPQFARFDREKFLEACGYYKYMNVAAQITRDHQPVYFKGEWQ